VSFRKKARLDESDEDDGASDEDEEKKDSPPAKQAVTKKSSAVAPAEKAKLGKPAKKEVAPAPAEGRQKRAAALKQKGYNQYFICLLCNSISEVSTLPFSFARAFFLNRIGRFAS